MEAPILKRIGGCPSVGNILLVEEVVDEQLQGNLADSRFLPNVYPADRLLTK
jgi:hypothetical protein